MQNRERAKERMSRTTITVQVKIGIKWVCLLNQYMGLCTIFVIHFQSFQPSWILPFPLIASRARDETWMRPDFWTDVMIRHPLETQTLTRRSWPTNWIFNDMLDESPTPPKKWREKILTNWFHIHIIHLILPHRDAGSLGQMKTGSMRSDAVAASYHSSSSSSLAHLFLLHVILLFFCLPFLKK